MWENILLLACSNACTYVSNVYLCDSNITSNNWNFLDFVYLDVLTKKYVKIEIENVQMNKANVDISYIYKKKYLLT